MTKSLINSVLYVHSVEYYIIYTTTRDKNFIAKVKAHFLTLVSKLPLDVDLYMHVAGKCHHYKYSKENLVHKIKAFALKVLCKYLHVSRYMFPVCFSTVK